MVAKRKIQLSKEARRLEILIRSLVVAGPEDNRTGSPQGHPEWGLGRQEIPRDLLIYSGRKRYFDFYIFIN